MSVVTVLKKARRLLTAGLAPQDCLMRCATEKGTPCNWRDEGVAFFSVHGALAAASGGVEAECLAAWDILEWVTVPSRAALNAFRFSNPPHDAEYKALPELCRSGGAQQEILEWSTDPRRTVEQVLRAFDLAILRATRGAS